MVSGARISAVQVNLSVFGVALEVHFSFVRAVVEIQEWRPIRPVEGVKRIIEEGRVAIAIRPETIRSVRSIEERPGEMAVASGHGHRAEADVGLVTALGIVLIFIS